MKRMSMKTFYKKHFGFEICEKITTNNGLILVLQKNITANQAQKYFNFNEKCHKIETPQGYYEATK